MKGDVADEDEIKRSISGTVKPAPLLCSARLSLALIGFVGFVNLYALRVNISVAMVCMINHTALSEHSSNDLENTSKSIAIDPNCGRSNGTTKTKSKDGDFEWDKVTQGLILASFFWGYIISQIPGGWLARHFGGKRVFGYCMLGGALATLLCPVGSIASPYLLMVLRVILGLAEGVVFPCMHHMWASWAPTLERSKLISFTYAGAQVGNVITLPISGLLCEYGFAGGWGSVFYVFGIFGVIWFILWMLLVSETPAEHRRISNWERNYIQSTTSTAKSHQKHLKTPWSQIFRSMPVWAIIVAHTTCNWGTYMALTNVPTYMKEVLKFDIKENGFLSAIPYILYWITINVSSVIADKLRAKGFQTKNVRKLMIALASILPAALFIWTGHVTCESPYLAVTLLSLSVGLMGFQYPGFAVNHVDIAPPFAGILFGISNTFASLPGILAPYAVGKITQNQQQEQWQIVFYITAAIYIFGGVFFCVFADGVTQKWVTSYLDETKESVDEKHREDSKAFSSDNTA